MEFRRNLTASCFAVAALLSSMLIMPAFAAPGQAPSTAVTGLHRFDFRLEGASCARCIINVRNALRASKGVKRCEISLRKPFGGVVVYDPAATNSKSLTAIILKADPKTEVTVREGVDEAIAKLPLVLIPKYTSLDKASN